MCEGDIKSFNSIVGQKDSCNNLPLGIKNIIPSVDNNSADIEGDYQFLLGDFTKNFTTSDGSTFNITRIVSLPDEGVIKFNNISITNDFEFDLNDISKLTYILNGYINSFTQSFIFQTSNNNLNKYFSNMATFTFNINQYVNLPPSAVGDNAVTIENAATYIFTTADFTTNTTPAYSDPEGDLAANLKVLTLPTDGVLQFNSVDVTINQIIPFTGATSITSGALQFIASQVNDAADVEAFTFQISDVGSNTFVG
jgi:hypothetical protein